MECLSLCPDPQGDKWKRAFNTSLGYLEYLAMRLESTNAPAVFQFVYIDDVLSETLEEHIQRF